MICHLCGQPIKADEPSLTCGGFPEHRECCQEDGTYVYRSGTSPKGDANPHPIPPAGGFNTPPTGTTYRDGYVAGLINGYREGREDEADGEPMPEWAK